MHTPPPWRTDDGKNIVAGAHHGFTVASVDTFTGNSVCPPEECAANARLIAAAPALARELQRLTEWARTHTGPTQPNSPHAILIDACAALESAGIPLDRHQD